MEYSDEQRETERQQCEPAGKAIEAEEYDKAYRILEPLAKQGNVAAMIDLGRLNARQLSSNASFELALNWFKRAAAAGRSSAHAEIGAIYESSQFQAPSVDGAFKAYQEGAKLDDPECMFSYGRCFLLGQGTQQHTANALIWIGKAAHNNHAVACYWMGSLYLDGQYMEADQSMASNFYERAATLGHPYAQNKLGLMYRDGIGREKNPEQAWNLFWLSANQGNSWGQFLLGECYYLGVYVQQDYEAAR